MQPIPTHGGASRRQFIGGVLASAAAGTLAAPAIAAQPGGTRRRIRLGVVGNGGRGSWIANLFAKDDGYQIHAVADYFPDVARKLGDALGVPPARQFSGLGGCRRLLASGVEAVVLKTPVCFFADHAAAAVDAGVHVYMAKPVAVDVPGCLTIRALGEQAARKKLVFLVDYQLPHHPANQQVKEAIRAGTLGPVARIITTGISGGHADPPRTSTVESRLRQLIWCNDVAMGGGYLLSFDIHALDAAVWALGRVPVAATGLSRIVRPDPAGDAHDVTSLVYQYADGMIHEHFGQALPNRAPSELSCRLYTYNAQAMVTYWNDAYYEVRGQKRVQAPVTDLYLLGAKQNIADFHKAIVEGDYTNATVPRAVDGCLTGILGREAARRGRRLTMEELLAENKRIEADLSGLKV